MRLILLLSVIVLASCGQAATSAPAQLATPPGYIGDSLAGQQVVIEATRVAFEIQVARASESAAITQAAISGTATERAAFITQAVIAGTSGAATSTQAADNLALAVAQGQATQAAIETSASWNATQAALSLAPGQTQQAQVATTQAQVITQTDRARSNGFYSIVIAVFVLVILSIVAFYSWRTARAVSRKASPENDTQAVRVLRLNVGTLILTPTRDGVHRELIPLPSGPPELPDFEDDAESDESIPVYHGGNLQTFFDRQTIDDEHTALEANRAALLKFLRQAIATAGGDSNRLPGWREMQIASATWSKAVGLLGENVTARPGKGTFITGQWPTIGELYIAVGSRSFIPRVTVEHSPTPSAVFARDA